MNTTSKAILIVLAALTLGGCSIGQSEFNCSSGDENALCGSTRSIYTATNGELDENTKITYIVDGEAHQVDVNNLAEFKGKLKNPDGETIRGASSVSISEKLSDQVIFQVAHNEHSKSVGDVVRTKAKVMTIGINRWVDQDDVFHMPSMILVDIEARRWNAPYERDSDTGGYVIPFKPAEPKKSSTATKTSSGKAETSSAKNKQ